MPNEPDSHEFLLFVQKSQKWTCAGDCMCVIEMQRCIRGVIHCESPENQTCISQHRLHTPRYCSCASSCDRLMSGDAHMQVLTLQRWSGPTRNWRIKMRKIKPYIELWCTYLDPKLLNVCSLTVLPDDDETEVQSIVVLKAPSWWK